MEVVPSKMTCDGPLACPFLLLHLQVSPYLIPIFQQAVPKSSMLVSAMVEQGLLGALALAALMEVMVNEDPLEQIGDAQRGLRREC